MSMSLDIFFILLSLSFVLLIGVCVWVILLLSKKYQWKNNSWELQLLQKQLLHLSHTLDTKLSDSTKSLTQNMSQTIKNSQEIAHISNTNIANITKKLTEITETNKHIKDIWSRLEWLESILKNPKRRGNLWEYFLKELLENVFTEGQYLLQYQLSTGIVDAALFVWNMTIPIDAKFPQENYEKLVSAEEDFVIKSYSNALKKDIHTRIDEVAKYILPNEGTTDFAFMLIPAEWMYYDIFINKLWDIAPQKLIEYGFSKKVIISSPSGFYAYLQTVIQWMKSLQIEKQAKEIQKYVLKLQKDLEKYELGYQKLGNALNTTVNHYNDGKKRLDIIDKDIVMIAPDDTKKRQLKIEEVDTTQ